MREQTEREPQNWRKPLNIDKEFENISNQISTLAMEPKEDSKRIPGVIQLPQNRMGRGGGGGNNFNNNNNNSRRRNNSQNFASSSSSSNRPTDSISLSKFLATCPAWYQSQEGTQIHDKNLIDNLVECDFDMHELVKNGTLIHEWDTFETYRRCVQQLLQQFIVREIKFCMTHNVENHIWKVLYYNAVEMLKAHYNDEALPEDARRFYREKALAIIDEGLGFFDRCVKLLEEQYKFSVNDYIGENALIVTKGLRFLGLALVSTQKMFLFLGDLARYRELINETQNFGISRQWYTKAQQIMPSNGRPYYQLGVLSVYSVSGCNNMESLLINCCSSAYLFPCRRNRNGKWTQFITTCGTCCRRIR